MNLKTILSATAFLAASPTALALADQAPSDTARHILNFEDVELSALIADVSTVTGYTFVVHPEARTKRITVSSTTPLTRQQVFDVFLSSLRVHGFTAVRLARTPTASCRRSARRARPAWLRMDPMPSRQKSST